MAATSSVRVQCSNQSLLGRTFELLCLNSSMTRQAIVRTVVTGAILTVDLKEDSTATKYLSLAKLCLKEY